MRALHFVSVGKLEWHEAPSPRLEGPLEAIVRPIASTTCDLDRRIITGIRDFGTDFPIGHECVAEVMEVGDGVRNVGPGDLCVVPWHISCGVCPHCRRGLTAACASVPRMSGYGVPIGGKWGGLFSEEVKVPFADGMLTKLPPGVDPVLAAGASDNLTLAYVSVWRGLAKHPGAPVLVTSSLPSLGLLVVDAALAAGAASVDFVDTDEERREIARVLGARVTPSISPDLYWKYPVVVNAAKEKEILSEAVKCLAAGGHIDSAAMFFEDTPLPLWEFYKRDITFSMGTLSVTPHLPKVLHQLQCGHIHPEQIVTRHPWDEAPDVLAESKMKPVLVRPLKFS